MKAELHTSPAVGNTVIRLVFLGGVLMACVYVITALCATALKVLG